MDEQRRREEAEYLGLFEEVPSGSEIAISQDNAAPAGASNAPVVEVEPEPEPQDTIPPADKAVEEPGNDLGAVRDELKKRQESPEQF